jgi:hypothetical protein
VSGCSCRRDANRVAATGRPDNVLRTRVFPHERATQDAEPGMAKQAEAVRAALAPDLADVLLPQTISSSPPAGLSSQGRSASAMCTCSAGSAERATARRRVAEPGTGGAGGASSERPACLLASGCTSARVQARLDAESARIACPDWSALPRTIRPAESQGSSTISAELANTRACIQPVRRALPRVQASMHARALCSAPPRRHALSRWPPSFGLDA